MTTRQLRGSHQNQWTRSDRQNIDDQLARAERRADVAFSNAKWRLRNFDAGNHQLSILLPRPVWNTFDRIKERHGYKTRAAFLSAYLTECDKELSVATLPEVPLRSRKTKLVQDKLMIPHAQVDYIDAIKRHHGISRSAVLDILLLALPDPWEREVQLDFFAIFETEDAVSG